MTVTFAEPIDASETPYLTVQVNFGHGRPLVAARFEFFAVTGADDGSALPPDDHRRSLQTPADQRTRDADASRLADYFAEHAAATEPLRVELANLEERLRVLTEKFPTMVMDEADEAARDVHPGPRRLRAADGEGRPPARPPCCRRCRRGAPANRLGLAQWITMRENPLTARVAVNRFWQMLFGAGIVRTTADFGSQGEWPTHPELLDWLAVDFVESGWDVKALVRQDRHVGDLPADRRPPSAELARARSRTTGCSPAGRGFGCRPSSFATRRSKTSGLLVDRLGGPSVNPYTPGDLWREISHYGSTPATAQTFVQDHGEKLYRRSLYTYWKRTAPPPNMAAFDAPNRETCVVARPTTTTPLQALVLLNDVQFVEAARAFAERIVEHAATTTTIGCGGRLRNACRGRRREAELDVLDRGARSANGSAMRPTKPAAREYLADGESPRDEAIPVGRACGVGAGGGAADESERDGDAELS